VSRNFELMRQAGKGIGQRRRSQIAIDPADNSAMQLTMETTGPEATKGFEWMQTLGILQKHWRVSALFACIVMVTVTVVTIFSKPIYEATARVEIDPSGEKFSLNGSSSGSTDAEYLETQAQVLQGDTLALGVIRGLRLDQNPAVMGSAAAQGL